MSAVDNLSPEAGPEQISTPYTVGPEFAVGHPEFHDLHRRTIEHPEIMRGNYEADLAEFRQEKIQARLRGEDV